jgi:hypothetical protein
MDDGQLPTAIDLQERDAGGRERTLAHRAHPIGGPVQGSRAAQLGLVVVGQGRVVELEGSIGRAEPHDAVDVDREGEEILIPELVVEAPSSSSRRRSKVKPRTVEGASHEVVK